METFQVTFAAPVIEVEAENEQQSRQKASLLLERSRSHSVVAITTPS